MLDIQLIREKPEYIRKNLERRQQPEKTKLFDLLLKQDAEWRQLKYKIDNLKHEHNLITDEIKKQKALGKNAETLLKKAKEISAEIKNLDEKTSDLYLKVTSNLMKIPNLLDDSVPFGKDENDNVEVRKWGSPKTLSSELKPHGQLLEETKQADFKSAAKISGAGFYYLFDKVALLDLALTRFAIDSLMKKKYKLVEVPLMMRRKPYEGVVDLQDFEDVMYKVENEDLYLIATSEHPIVSIYMDEFLDELPQKFVGVSPCFRKEIGSHGIDTRGLFRVHQFNKVEQVILCKEEQSRELHEELISNTEKLFQQLELPYRVVNVCTGDLGVVASKKYDLEVWFPREKKYGEAASCSNCLSYQSKKLNIRYREKDKVKNVHTLNSTAVATSRAIRAIIENNQTKEGIVKIPKVLHPYMNGIKEIK